MCQDRKRGSWNLGGAEKQVKIDSAAFLEELLKKDSPYARTHGEFPSGRVALYGGQASVKESERMSCWKQGVSVIDSGDEVTHPRTHRTCTGQLHPLLQSHHLRPVA